MIRTIQAQTKISLLLTTCLAASMILSACSGSPGASSGSTSSGTPPAGNPVTAPASDIPTGTLQLGSKVDEGSATADPTGDILVVDNPGSPLHNFKLEIPAGAYTETKTFDVGYSPIEGHSFGSAIHPVTPLLSVENGGAYADTPMQVTIPAVIPAGHFGMAFYYLEDEKRIEAMPLINVTPTGVTVQTRHFSKFFVSTIQIVALRANLPVSTGFEPGVDDWQFPNWGSYIADGGHCAGQSVTMMWYYIEKKLKEGAPSLHDYYDNNRASPATPANWADDTRAYKFASSVHADINWAAYSGRINREYQRANQDIAWLGFAYSLKATKLPQAIGIYAPDGSGHAMLVYEMTPNELKVADPNYPGDKTRSIPFDALGKFGTYNSGANARDISAGSGTVYDNFVHGGNTGHIDFASIRTRFEEMQAGSIGSDRFPTCRLYVIDSNNTAAPMSDTPVTTASTIKFEAACTTKSGTILYANFLDFNTGGKPADQNQVLTRSLQMGDNPFEFALFNKTIDTFGNVNFQYIDYARFSVKREEPLNLSKSMSFKSISVQEGDFKLHDTWVTPPSFECSGSLGVSQDLKDPSDWILKVYNTWGNDYNLAMASVVPGTTPISVNLSRTCGGIGWDNFKRNTPYGSVELVHRPQETILSYQKVNFGEVRLTQAGPSGNFNLNLTAADLADGSWTATVYIKYDRREIYTMNRDDGTIETQYGAWQERWIQTLKATLNFP